MAPTLSVITTIDAVHNHDPGGAICELLKGMKNQSSPPAWELVFVNQPGHPIGPEAEAALEELATECTVRRSMAPQAGRAAAHNRGAEVARGDLLLFLGSDFRPRSALLRAHVDLHRDRPEAGVVGLGGALFPDEPWRTPFMRWMDRRGHTFGTRFLDGGRPPARFFYAVNTSVKRTFFERVGPFREELVGAPAMITNGASGRSGRAWTSCICPKRWQTISMTCVSRTEESRYGRVDTPADCWRDAGLGVRAWGSFPAGPFGGMAAACCGMRGTPCGSLGTYTSWLATRAGTSRAGEGPATPRPPGMGPRTMADVFVHIGYHKTGTTYLQRRIFDRHPRVQRPWGPEHLTRFFLWPDPLRFDAESTRASILSKASDGPLVLSCENLVGRAIHGGMMKRVLADRIQRTFPDARIIIGIRNQPETMVSLYKQYVRLGGTAPFGEFVRIGPPALVPLLRPSHLEYDRLIAHYRGLFGARRVHVMLQEDLAARTQATVDALTGFLGVEPLDAPQERVHASFDDRTVESLRRRNLRSWNPDMHTFHGPGRWRLPIGRRVVLATRERLLRRQRETPTSAYLDQARKLAASHHAASNQRTADLLGRSDLGDLGYPMPAA